MKVSNPLTIIAIFAGLAEALATVALLGLPQELQKIFLIFVMAFPTLIVILFFLVLYFKNNVLYAPGDYQDPEHYLRVNSSDIKQAMRYGLSNSSSIKDQDELSQESIGLAKVSSDLASRSIDIADEVTNELFQPALELLVFELLKQPGHVRDKIVNEIESEKLKNMLTSILGKIKSKFGEDAYNKPIQPTALAVG